VWRPLLLSTLLLGWLFALLLLANGAADGPFILGRERWFALTLNGVFLLAIAVYCFRFQKVFSLFPKLSSAIGVAFVTILIVTGWWAPLIASISGPPWECRDYGMPASAPTPYMESVWAWERGDENQG
jgi:hypothetical protein